MLSTKMCTDNKEIGPAQVVYQFFGLNLISDYPFTSRLRVRMDKPDLIELPHALYFTCNQLPPFPVNWEAGKLVYSYRYSTPNGELWDKLYHFDIYDVFRFSSRADYYLSPGRIHCHLHNQAYQSSVETHLLGAVLAFWLEREGFPALHASAVMVGSQVVTFPSHSGNGKTTLATALLQAGAALFTDDILPIEKQADGYWARPSLPQINLWPDQATHFIGSSEDSEAMFTGALKRRVHVETVMNGRFCHEQKPLACIYIPRKSSQLSSGSDIEITPIPPAEAMIELVRYSFVPPAIFEKIGWQGRRLDFFARLVKLVPVRRLLYPAGFEHLPRVTEAVLRDLENLPSR